MAIEDSNQLIREVNEEMRRDRMVAAWRVFADKIIYISIAIVLVTTGILFWQNHMRTLKEERSEQMAKGYELYKAGQFKEAEAVFAELTAAAKPPMATLAAIWHAKTALKDQKTEEAVGSLAQVVGQAGASDDVLTRFACLQGAMIAPDDERFKACQPTLQDDPFYPLAVELSASQQLLNEDHSVLPTLPQGMDVPRTQARRFNDLDSYARSSREAADAQ